ncbi:MAG: 7-carboxy-7-deazaguanine synthase QueE [Rickettsiales bacterium]|nr:7-carboxy-7-deazaguanine synthase QueE [Pseudomonadota bacterium]MDA0966775.1 7-carboxy-7-deazaguanine synthase QueE [Pseudomonadota bacterium]MDG4543447.1 7-carboxy-7-deazaguanine synthase QueE [Rickettsiales bacterium]MDG4546159.1 7-carboxy-7-deazaguanine synthase QueE [Rickettsiales bacterium]MDG4547632.1 7-carboxy-7-deazaguanine synthase QueE [Rickettsiales bacterium]
MFGQNPIRKPEKGDGSILQVQEIFPTFQGEGPFVGHPAIFIRLGGCNLACDFCDTEFETFADKSIDEIVETANNFSGKGNNNFTHKLIVITGGEPLRQPIEKLCEELINNGYKVQIETNGTLYRNVHKDVSIVCSPKTTNNYAPIREDLLQRLDCLKFIISATHPLYQDIGDVGQHKYNIPVYIQPMDELNAKKNQNNLEYAIRLASKNGYNISLQTHKIIGIE